MKQSLILLALLVISFNSLCQVNIEGKWKSDKNNTIIEIYKIDNGWEGKLVASDNKDVELNKVILKDITKKEGYWEGQFFIPPLNSWLDAKLNPKKKTMKITVRNWLMKKSKEWTRVIDEKVK